MIKKVWNNYFRYFKISFNESFFALLLGILGGFAERIFTVTEKSNRIDTFVKADLVYSHKVYVNGLEVALKVL